VNFVLVTSIEYKLFPWEISDVMFIERMESERKKVSLLQVVNREGINFYLEILNFSPE
jgi:hypothetical protein